MVACFVCDETLAPRLAGRSLIAHQQASYNDGD